MNRFLVNFFLQSLKLDTTGLNRITTGHVINLVASDTEFFENCSVYFPDLIIGPPVIIGSAVIFVYIYGLVGLIGVGIFILIIPIQSIIRIFGRIYMILIDNICCLFLFYCSFFR